MTTFEQGFEETERAADGASRAVGSLLAVTKQLKKAAHDGDVVAIRRSCEKLAATMDTVRQEIANARGAWPFGEEAEILYLRDEYELELLAASRAVGLQMDRRDGRLLAFPSVVRVLSGDRSLKIDQKRVASLRPSGVVAVLKANQGKKPKLATDRFLESLFRAYRLIVGASGPGAVVPLAAVYEALTILPSTAADYGHSEFARDLFMLDRSGVTQTKAGATVSLPASTGTKGGKATFSVIAPDGELVTYFGLRFEAPR